MSLIKLQGNPSGSGAFTIAAPNGNTDRTLTLPDNTGTILTSASTSVLPKGVPVFSAVSAGATSVSNNTATKINFATEQFDTASCYDTSTSRYTPNVAGYYQFNATCYIAGAAYSQLYFNKNGATVYSGNYAGSNGSSIQMHVGAAIIYMNGSTDYAEIYFYQSSGGTQNVSGGHFQAVLVRAD